MFYVIPTNVSTFLLCVLNYALAFYRPVASYFFKFHSLFFYY